MKKNSKKLTIAYDTNTYRSKYLISFLIKHQDNFEIKIPAIIYAEKGFSYLLNGETYENFRQEINSYKGQILPLSASDIEKTMNLAYQYKKRLPFREHSRDYFIAGQCLNMIDVFITYNKKHFQVFDLKSTEIKEPEEFMRDYI